MSTHMRNIQRALHKLLKRTGQISIGLCASLYVSQSWGEQLQQQAIDPARYDWVPISELDESHQHSRLSPSCRGAYVDPLAGQKTSSDLSDEPIYIEADASHMTARDITLDGNVEISQGSRELKANHMGYDQKTDQANLEGQVVIRQPDLLVRGTSAHVNMAGREARFEGGEFVIHSSHLRGSAASIEHQADGKIVLEDGSLTSCEPSRESWLIKGSKLSVDPVNQSGSGRNITIEVGGIPILYTPYITFPFGDARQSGLLVPSVGTSEGGLDITIPWYWNIAPNYDATIAPRFAAGHGAILESEWRHLNKISYNTLNMAFLANDKGAGDPDTINLAIGANERLYRGQDRWLLSFLHEGGDDSRWYTDINYTKVSDIDYFRDLSTESFTVINNTYLNQNATIGYRLPNWHISARVQEYQNLLVDIDEIYQQRPRLQFNGRYTWNAWALSLKNEWAMFDHPSPEFITGQRANIDYNIEHGLQRLWGFVRPKIGIQSLIYSLDDDNLANGANNSPSLNTPYASLDAGLFFERDNGRQTIEPRIFYLYRKYADHSDLLSVTDPSLGNIRDVNFDTTLLTFSYDQLFRDRRFAGGDRLGDANQLAIGLTSNLLSKDQSYSIASISLGKVVYFSDREVSISNTDQTQTIEESDLATKMTVQLNKNVQLRGDFLYNPKTERVMRATTGVEYQDRHNRRVKLDYRYVREDSVEQTTLPVNQLDSAAILPIGDQWQVVGRIFYDLDDHKELDAFVGFEYDDCCYRVRLLARRWLDSKLADLVTNDQRYYDKGLFLEVDLKGLASSGNKIQKLLQQTLPGFRD